MIVLAVLGLAIGIAYATANRSLLAARQSQENTQATEIIQAQAEALRSLAGNEEGDDDYIYLADPFCVDKASGHVVKKSDVSYHTKCSQGEASRYLISVKWDGPGHDTFVIKATWEDVSGGSTLDTNTLTYRVHKPAESAPTRDHSCPAGFSGTWPDCHPPPPGVSISVSPSTITKGDSATLSWVSSNATSCTASGAWSGSKPVTGTGSTGTLNATSTFTIKCTGDSGIASDSVEVKVDCPAGYDGTAPDCHRIPCPENEYGTYPDCRPNPCPAGMYQGDKWTYDYYSPQYPWMGYGDDVPPYCVPWSI
jgi:hypothetical protein